MTIRLFKPAERRDGQGQIRPCHRPESHTGKAVGIGFIDGLEPLYIRLLRSLTKAKRRFEALAVEGLATYVSSFERVSDENWGPGDRSRRCWSGF